MSKVVNPNNTTHSIFLQGRFNAVGSLTMFLTNKETDIETEVTSGYMFGMNGVGMFTFDFDFKERDMYQVRIMEGGKVFYRGRIFATSQDPQEFDIIKNYIEV